MLSNVAEKGAEAGALYLEAKEKVESVAEKMTYKQELIAARFQNIQENFTNKLNVLKIRSHIPISNSHLLSLAYHLSLEVSYAIFNAITDPTLASTVILTAISERKLPEVSSGLRLGKLTLEETQQFVIGLGEGVGHLRGFEGQIADKQSISKLIDYRLDPKPNDREAATTLLNYILACTEIGTNNSLLSNSNIARVAANRYAQQG
ncbi:uncharacterized protein TNCT_451861 [Trichonephila clavata]|uniref:Uncharacterized protein n=1 Tax=Trichonephila clavata TaxID=2740835 RepID=A0A8X6GAB0_TRICU|nr:uncharacterized protein TNCT_451861 [Trichonephila clavata]